MTQISGKKYQMRNAAGTENRFPYTVMEAVLGLNTYLQDQFSALADIYMPIEGITESKTGQEFVYRKSPATIKAKSITLDRIYGKTLAWNQLIQYGDSVSTSNGWSVSNGTLSGNVFTATAPNGYIATPGYAMTTHKLFLAAVIKTDAEANKVHCYTGNSGAVPEAGNVSSSGIQVVKQIGTSWASASGTGYGFIMDYRTSGWTPITIYSVCVIDLTLLFGSGNEPATVGEFEALFPLPYYDYNEGTLISNKADSLETVGFNQWDEEWESGIWNPDTGEAGAGYQKIRSKNFIPVFPSTAYYYRESGVSSNVNILCYDADKNYIGGSTGFFANINNFTTPANCRYIKFYNDAGYGSTYNHDICINLSDPAKNGTYEPYRKTTLQLGLNNFKVKSHNIWDEEWELGAYSNGIKIASPDRIRCKNPIPCLPSTVYKETVVGEKSNTTFNFTFFDDNGNVISGLQVTNTTFETPSNCHYFVFATTTSYYGSTYNHDICINVSSSFNGQYEPHGDIAITGGLKSAGSVKDEIVGNKYIKRVGRVDLGTLSFQLLGISGTEHTFINTNSEFLAALSGVCSKYVSAGNSAINDQSNDKTFAFSSIGTSGLRIHDSALSASDRDANGKFHSLAGVMLYYELATPIEYELVEPLVYSMAAGTTEERISPNSDGLSAPFCCDMTYDANANNDSANAQYAATAGRLYNTHKIWGQDFNGTQDLSGDLTGVGNISFETTGKNIASLLYFDTANGRIGIGSAPGAYKFDVAGTLRATGATTLSSTLTVSGATTLSSTVAINDHITIANSKYFQYKDTGGNARQVLTLAGNDLVIGYGTSAQGYTTYLDGNIISFRYGTQHNTGIYLASTGNVGIGTISPSVKLDVNGALNASGATTLGSTLGVIGNTTIGGTFTVGTSSVNKATTLYGALTASGAVSFSDTLTIAGLTTFNGNAILPANKTFTIGPASGTHATLEWDATNGCVKITGNLRVTGWIEQQGTQSNS